MSATHPAPGRSSPSLANTFALILDQLRRAAAARLAANRAATPVLLILWSRLHRISMRFASLLSRYEAGALCPPRPAGTRPERTAPPPRRLPTGFGWLTQLVPEARAYASQLQYLISRPEMIALLDADPRFRRLLRPLCRMLALPPPTGSPPTASPPQAKAAATQPQPRTTGSEDGPILTPTGPATPQPPPDLSTRR